MLWSVLYHLRFYCRAVSHGGQNNWARPLFNGSKIRWHCSATSKGMLFFIFQKMSINILYINLDYTRVQSSATFSFQVAIYLPSVTFDQLPMIIFGSTTFLAGVLSIWLPETLGAPFVESLDEIYILHKYSKPLFSWWSVQQVNQNIEKINSLSLQRKTSSASQVNNPSLS